MGKRTKRKAKTRIKIKMKRQQRRRRQKKKKSENKNEDKKDANETDHFTSEIIKLLCFIYKYVNNCYDNRFTFLAFESPL